MANSALVAHIVKARQAGESDDVIRTRLAKVGHSAEDLNSAFAVATLQGKGVVVDDVPVLAERPAVSMNLILATGGAVVLGVVLAFLYVNPLGVRLDTVGSIVAHSLPGLAEVAPAPAPVPSSSTPLEAPRVYTPLYSAHSSVTKSAGASAPSTSHATVAPPSPAPTPHPSTGVSVPVATAPNASAPTAHLTVNATQITQGDSVTLSWTSENATSCLSNGGFSTGGAPTGTANVSPVLTTSFAVTCKGAGGTAKSTVEVTVAVGGSAADTIALESSDTEDTNPLPADSSSQTSSTGSTDTTAGSDSGTAAASGSGNTASQTGTATGSTGPVATAGGTLVHNPTELTAALKALNGKSGGTILLAPGNYGTYSLGIQYNLGYSFPSMVTVTSQDLNNRATFDSLTINLDTNLTVTNVDLPNVPSGAKAVTVNGSHNVLVAGIYAHSVDGTGGGFWSRNNSNVTARNSEWANFGVAMASYQDVGDISFLYNYAHNVASDAIDAYQDPGTITIRGNYVIGFDPPSGAHPDCIQTSGGNAQTSRVILDENLCVRGPDPGALPPQGVFAGDGPYAYVEEDDDLTVCTLYNAFAISAAGSGEIKRSQTISCPDYGTWIRVQGSNGVTVSDNIAPAYIQPSPNTNTVFINNATTGPEAVVKTYLDAAPQISAWRAKHPLVPTGSGHPSYVALAEPRKNIVQKWVLALAPLIASLGSSMAAVLEAVPGLHP